MNALTRTLPAALLCAASGFAQVPVDQAIPYQGTLRIAGTPVTGTADLQFRLFDAPSGGMQIGATKDINNVNLVNGEFTIPLDFGAGSINGEPRYLEIAARSPAGTGNFFILTPRQPMAPAPYAHKVLGRDGHSLDGANGGPADALNVSIFGEVGINTPLALGPLDVHAGNGSYLRVDAVNGDLHMNGGFDRVNGIYNDTIGLDGRIDLILNNAPHMILSGANAVSIGTVTTPRRFTLMHDGIFMTRLESTNPIATGAEFWNTTSDQGFALMAYATDGDLRFFRMRPAGDNAVEFAANSWLGLGQYDPDFRLELPDWSFPTGRARANRWDTYSSGRWKNNVQPIEHALDKVRQLRGVSFDWKPEHGGARDIGFVAEEVGKVVPELVSWEPDGVSAKSLAYDHMTALTVEAIKEQQARLERQRVELDRLHKESAELRERVASLARTLVAEGESETR